MQLAFVSGSMRFLIRPKRKRKGNKMVGAISSTSLLSTSSTSSTSSNSSAQIASLQAQIEAKQTELEEAKTEDDKAEITEEIAELQAKLKALEATEARKTQAQQTAASNGQSSQEEPATLIGTRNFQDGEQFGNRELWV
ncbi:MAG: hypothetical protein AAAC47_29585 [Pararhizobium sp.]